MDRNRTADELAPRMSDADALLRTTITSITILDRAPDRDRLLRRIDRGSRRIPRLRQRVVSLPLGVAPPRWEIDPHFDLRYHVRWMRAVGAGTTRELFDIAEPIAMQGFDRARPLWELVVVEGLADERAAVIMKIHHSITDAVGALRLRRELVDREREPVPAPEDQMPPAPRARAMTEARRLADAVTDETARQARGVAGAVSSLLGSLGRLRDDPVGVATGTVQNLVSLTRMLTPAVEPLSPLMTGRSLSVRFGRIDLPRASLEAAGRLVSGQLDDVVVAGLAGGLARYHRYHGYEDVGMLRLAMPTYRPGGDAPAPANRFAPLRFNVPVDMDDPLERLNAIRFIADRERSEPALAMSSPVANMVNRLPTTATTALFGSIIRGVDVIAANAGGTDSPRYLAGAGIEAQIAFGPLAGAGISVMSTTYGDQVNVGVALDPAAVTDTEALFDCLHDGYDEVLKLV